MGCKCSTELVFGMHYPSNKSQSQHSTILVCMHALMIDSTIQGSNSSHECMHTHECLDCDLLEG